jgi:hypothetical protein
MSLCSPHARSVDGGGLLRPTARPLFIRGTSLWSPQATRRIPVRSSRLFADGVDHCGRADRTARPGLRIPLIEVTVNGGKSDMLYAGECAPNSPVLQVNYTFPQLRRLARVQLSAA